MLTNNHTHTPFSKLSDTSFANSNIVTNVLSVATLVVGILIASGCGDNAAKSIQGGIDRVRANSGADTPNQDKD